MADNYCGKSCDQCPKHLDASCVGCRNGVYSRDCRIARCCAERGHEFCGTCTGASTCITRRLRDQMPQMMLDAQRRDGEQMARRMERAQTLGRWLWPIFWLMIAQTLISQLEIQWISDRWPIVGQVSGVLVPALLVVIALCNMQLRSVDERYRTLGFVQLGLAGYNLAERVFPENGLMSILLLIAALVLTVVSKYCQCFAHADALYGIDDALAEKWMDQWNYHKIVFISLPVICILMFVPLVNLVAILAMIAILILLIVVLVREFVYLYRMAVLFRNYPGEGE